MKNTTLVTGNMEIVIKVITMDMMLGITITGNQLIPIKIVITIIRIKMRLLVGFHSNKCVTMAQIPITT